MSKKILSLILCLLMLMVPVLTSCGADTEAETGEEADVSEETKRNPMTLSFWIPTSEDTTEEAIEQVEAALNILLSSKYNTNIELNAIPEDEYESVLDDKLIDIDTVKTNAAEAAESERLQAIEDAENGIIREDADKDDPVAETGDAATAAPEEAETILDEYGQAITVYPEVADDQLDIFLVKGYDKFREYREKDLLSNLDDAMTKVGYKMYSYVYPTFFDLSRENGSVYAIPNNHALGQYELLLVNKDLVAKYDYAEEELTTLLECEEFILDIASQNLDGIVPLLGECEAPNMVYFSSNGEWSLFASQIKSGVSASSTLAPVLTLNTDYIKTFGMMKRLNEKGAIGDGTLKEGEDFAVAVLKGDASLFDKYADDYYVNIHGVPYADVDDVFESSFCISKYTKDSTRAMEVITYLNTDETVRTILQYGVEGVHWRLDNSGDEPVIKLLDESKNYVMNLNDTGNVYLTYPGEGIGKSYWKYAMKQNGDSSANPYVGFEYLTDDNTKIFQSLATYSADCLEE
ncbi:MAG: hypothetical protein IKZ03_01090, partial [Clostridia bacterium]|nr:hypothetical protein [Clostridia bacterium]